MYTGNGKLFQYRKALYTFFKAYTDKINWEETAVPMDYCSFNPREIYSVAVRIDPQTVGYAFIMITGRRATVERPITTNVRVFLSLDGIDFTNEYLQLDNEPEVVFNQLCRFILNN